MAQGKRVKSWVEGKKTTTIVHISITYDMKLCYNSERYIDS